MAHAAERRSFPTGAIVPAEDLVGREDAVRDLLERTYRQGNSVVLTAPRQTGKTSVVFELLRRVRKAGGWGIYIDCSRATDQRDFAALVASSTYDQAAGAGGAFKKLADLVKGAPRPMLFHPDSELAVAFHSPTTPSTSHLLERALGLADTLAAEKKKRAVVVYDEFPRLRTISEKLFDIVRADLQPHSDHAAYIFMGSETGILDELFKSRGKMPFRLGAFMELPEVDQSAWLSYMETRFRELGRPLLVGESGRLYDLVGGHPRDLMEICQHLLTQRTLSKTPSSAADLDLASQRTMASLSTTFDQIWSALAQVKGARETAARIATSRKVYERGRETKMVQRSIQKLENEGLVRKVDRGKHVFTEPLFGAWVRATVSR